MTDSLRAKLERMASRGTPHEAEIARAKLERLGTKPSDGFDAVASAAEDAADVMAAFYKSGWAEGDIWTAWAEEMARWRDLNASKMRDWRRARESPRQR